MLNSLHTTNDTITTQNQTLAFIGPFSYFSCGHPNTAICLQLIFMTSCSGNSSHFFYLPLPYLLASVETWVYGQNITSRMVFLRQPQGRERVETSLLLLPWWHVSFPIQLAHHLLWSTYMSICFPSLQLWIQGLGQSFTFLEDFGTGSVSPFTPVAGFGLG